MLVPSHTIIQRYASADVPMTQTQPCNSYKRSGYLYIILKAIIPLFSKFSKQEKEVVNVSTYRIYTMGEKITQTLQEKII